MMTESLLLIALFTAAIVVPAIFLGRREDREIPARSTEAPRDYERRAS